MSVEECSPLCFRVVLKGFSELYFQARISFSLWKYNEILSQSKTVIYSFEIIQFEEITLVLSQPQGADPGAGRILLLWE